MIEKRSRAQRSRCGGSVGVLKRFSRFGRTGVVAPLVMHSATALATTSLLLMLIGLVAWVYLHHRWPEIGRHATH